MGAPGVRTAAAYCAGRNIRPPMEITHPASEPRRLRPLEYKSFKLTFRP
jgi:hypothetical protein